MKASQLRDLTRAFAADRIGEQAYRAERTRLIDGIVSGEIEVRYREVEPSAPVVDERPRRHWQHVAGAGLVGLLLVALVAYFLAEPPASSSTRAQPTKAKAPAQDPGVQLLAGFDANGKWPNARLEEFETAWAALTPFQRESARRSPEFRRLEHETSRRIREQEALLATGKMSALVRAVRLRKFGERLGFETE